MNKSVASLLFAILMIQATTPTFTGMTVIVKNNQHDQQAWLALKQSCSSTINTQCAASAVQLASQECSSATTLFQQRKCTYRLPRSLQSAMPPPLPRQPPQKRHCNVTAHPTAAWTLQQLRDASCL